MNPMLHRFRSSLSAATAVRHTFTVLCCGGLLGLFTGCASEPESHLVSAPPPSAPTKSVTTTTTTSSAPQAVPVDQYGRPAATAPASSTSTTIVTQTAPPALQTEPILAQPSSAHVWLPGYWTWRHDRYEWMAGHWELPPSATSRWVAPSWEHQGAAYKFSEGYWN